MDIAWVKVFNNLQFPPLYLNIATTTSYILKNGNIFHTKFTINVYSKISQYIYDLLNGFDFAAFHKSKVRKLLSGPPSLRVQIVLFEYNESSVLQHISSLNSKVS